LCKTEALLQNNGLLIHKHMAQAVAPISADTIAAFLEECQEVPNGSIGGITETLSGGREFRSKTFQIPYLLLREPKKDFCSKTLPNPLQVTDSDGFLFLYDGKVNNYLDDGITWDSEKRMHVKLILHDPARKQFKLKNSKTDTGSVVMRRQTWKSSESGWRRHEYKLFRNEVYYKPEADGSLSVSEMRRLNDFPVLLHYMRNSTRKRRRPSVSSTATKRRKVKKQAPRQTKNSARAAEHPLQIKLETASSPPVTSSPFLLDPIFSSDDMSESEEDSTSISTSGHMMNLINVESLAEELCLDLSTPDGSPPPFAADTYTKEYNDMFSSDVTKTASLDIKSFAPDCGRACDFTKMLVFFKANIPDDINYDYQCHFDTTGVHAKYLSQGVLECYAPPREPGLCSFVISCKLRNDTTKHFSQPCLFHYLPANEQGKVNISFALRDMTDQEISASTRKFRHDVKELDLSNNNLSNLDFLDGFYQLQTLILDNNDISHETNLPRLFSLHTLSITSNRITNIEQFLDGICRFCPNLQYLNTIGNDCCPIYSQFKHHYTNYRKYIVSRLRGLKHLDSDEITHGEWRSAAWIKEDPNAI